MLTKVIPAVPYAQLWASREDIVAFFKALNDGTQEYVTWFAELYLPVWTLQEGDLLTWSAEGIYGIKRPIVPSGDTVFVGPYATAWYGELPYAGWGYEPSSAVDDASDDIFKRTMTWALYKGDGRQYTTEWIKRRIQRFLSCPDGAAGPVTNTYNVSVQIVGQVVTVRLVDYDDLEIAASLAYLLSTGALETPFQYTFDVVI